MLWKHFFFSKICEDTNTCHSFRSILTHLLTRSHSYSLNVVGMSDTIQLIIITIKTATSTRKKI